MPTIFKFDSSSLFHPTQKEVYDSFLWDGINVVAAGRRWGKSYLAGYILFLAALKKPGNYFWVAPSYKMSRDPWRRMKKLAVQSMNGLAKVHEADRRITLPNESIIEFHSADDPQSLRSQGLRGVVMDEFSKIPESAWKEAIQPSLTDYDDSWSLLIGTPFGINLFSEMFDNGQIGKNDTRSWQFTSYDNPHASLRKIEFDKITMSDREFRQEHLAEFIAESGFVFDRQYFNTRADKVDCRARYISIDSASTTGKNSAFTAVVVGELDNLNRLFIREVIQDKVEFIELEQMINRLIEKYNTDRKLEGIIIEHQSSGIALIQSLYATGSDEIAEKLIPFSPRVGKRQRAQIASKFVEKGSILLPNYTLDNKWIHDFEHQLIKFTGDDKDMNPKDMVDAFSQLVVCLQQPLSEGLLYKSGR